MLHRLTIEIAATFKKNIESGSLSITQDLFCFYGSYYFWPKNTLCLSVHCFDRQVKDPPLNIQDIPWFRHISRCFWYSQRNSNGLCCKRLLMWILTFASLPHYLQNNYTRFCVNTLCKSVEAVLMNLYFYYLRVSYTYTMNNSYFPFINLSNPPPIPLKSVSFTLNTIFFICVTQWV